MKLRLHNYFRSSASWRVRIALHLKGLEFEYVPVHLLRNGGEQRSAEHSARNPLMQVPTLEVLDDGPPRTLSQSMAILDYLEHLAPSPPLFPAAPFERAVAIELAEIVNSGIQPLQNLSVTDHIKKEFGQPSEPWTTKWITRGLDALEARVAAHGGRCAVGDAITLADVFLVPQLASARRFGVDSRRYARLSAIEDHLGEHPAFVAAHADRQPDATT